MGDNMSNIREKQHRLDESLYRGAVIVAFTCCEKNRQPLFRQEAPAHLFMKTLEGEAGRFGCDVMVDVFMPDHTHILLAGRDAAADTLKAMRGFKQKTGFWLSRNLPQFMWQKDYCDHILRTWERGEKELNKHIRYILNNPVRNGLVAQWKDYPYRGSTVFRLDEWE
jgi:REP element-mobilizing transposase RayT